MTWSQGEQAGLCVKPVITQRAFSQAEKPPQETRKWTISRTKLLGVPATRADVVYASLSSTSPSTLL